MPIKYKDLQLHYRDGRNGYFGERDECIQVANNIFNGIKKEMEINDELLTISSLTRETPYWIFTITLTVEIAKNSAMPEEELKIKFKIRKITNDIYDLEYRGVVHNLLLKTHPITRYVLDIVSYIESIYTSNLEYYESKFIRTV